MIIMRKGIGNEILLIVHDDDNHCNKKNKINFNLTFFLKMMNLYSDLGKILILGKQFIYRIFVYVYGLVLQSSIPIASLGSEKVN